MGIFRFRIVRLLFYIVCFSISISAMGHNDIYSVDSYKNILDIRYTPYSNDYFTGGFSDSGAWVCFTLPSEDNWVNGFAVLLNWIIVYGFRTLCCKSDLPLM